MKSEKVAGFGGFGTAVTVATDVRVYTRARLDAQASPGEINRGLAALKRMFMLAIQVSKVLMRPHIQMLAENNIRTGFFEREEFERVRAHLPAPLRPMVTSAYVGLADSERSPEIAVVATGGLIESRNRAARSRFDQPIKSIRKSWSGACAAAEVPGRIPHDFRRAAVRNLERAGVSRSVAMKLTGHKTELVYRRCAIVSEADLSVGVQKLAALGNGTIGGAKQKKTGVKRLGVSPNGLN